MTPPSTIGLSLAILGSSVGSPFAASSGTSHASISVNSESGNLPISPLPLHPSAISDLIYNNEASAPTALLGALRQDNLTLTRLSELLLLAETVQITDPEQRGDFLAILLKHAQHLRDSNSAAADPPLWSALRRFASLAPPDSAFELVEFLRPTDSATTRQSALLGLYSILELRPLPYDARLDLLHSRLTELTRKYLDLDWLVSGQNTALALASFTAAILAEVPSALTLAQKLKSLGRPRLTHRSITNLELACKSRAERGLPVPDRIYQTITILSTASSEASS